MSWHDSTDETFFLFEGMGFASADLYMYVCTQAAVVAVFVSNSKSL